MRVKIETLKGKLKDLTIFQQLIIKYLLNEDSKTRKDICNELNSQPTTIYDNLKKLEDKKIIWRLSVQNHKVGRSPVYWQIKYAHDLVLFYIDKNEQSNPNLCQHRK